MTLIFDTKVKVKITGGWSFNSYNYCLNYIPVESYFWPSVARIVENQNIDLEMTSRGQVDP